MAREDNDDTAGDTAGNAFDESGASLSVLPPTRAMWRAVEHSVTAARSGSWGFVVGDAPSLLSQNDADAAAVAGSRWHI